MVNIWNDPGAEGRLVPWALVARTTTKYLPTGSPGMDTEVPTVAAWVIDPEAGPVHVNVYEMIGSFPVLIGAVQVTVAGRAYIPLVVEAMVGAQGTVVPLVTQTAGLAGLSPARVVAKTVSS